MTLSEQELRLLDAYWRAANYLSVGQIYLLDNPLLREPLRPEHVKPRLLGHFGTTPGLNLVYAHLNRAIRARDLNAIYVTGPGPRRAGPRRERVPRGDVQRALLDDRRGRGRACAQLFRQFSFPGGIPSHVAPETPGSIHEGGELGYALAHAFGAAFDNPDLLVACVVGDGEAETGPLATSWHSNKFLNPRTDGAVLPILHLNGYKIANPTVLARIPEDELVALLEGYGWRPLLVAGDEPDVGAPGARGGARRRARRDRGGPARGARATASTARPRWPMIVLRTPKGWTGPEGGRRPPGRGHVALAPGARRRRARENPEHLRILEEWLRSYRPEELFDEDGRLVPELARARAARRAAHEREPARERRRAAARPRPARLPRLRRRGRGAGNDVERGDARARRLPARRDRPQRARTSASSARTRRRRTGSATSSRSPTAPGTPRSLPTDEHLAPDGRVMEVLSEHLCQGWLEGYLLTGRHGLFNCYEAFIHIVDSMFNQHAKWLKVTRDIPWRRPIASLNYLLSSHVWRQDHNGFSHQDPGFIDHVVNKKAEIIRVYLPPDANTLLSVADHCLRSRELRERDRRRQAARARTTSRWTTRSCTARAASASGTGRRTTTTASPTSCSPAAATSRRSRRSPPPRSCASACPT